MAEPPPFDLLFFLATCGFVVVGFSLFVAGVCFFLIMFQIPRKKR